MDADTLLNLLWPALVGSILMPLVQWIKVKIPKDLPLTPAFLTLALGLGLIALVDFVAGTGLPWSVMVAQVLALQVGGQMSHATVKTKKVLKNGSKPVEVE